MKKIKEILSKIFFELLFVAVLWLMIWGTYDADYMRILAPGFPHNALDLFHGLRVFLPFVAVILAISILVKKRINFPENFFLTPVGLLSIYAIVGIISSVFSLNFLWALYWATLYGSVVIVLLTILFSSESAKKLSTIININWAICGILSVALAVFFFMQPGVISSLTYNFLICSSRPYEGLAGVPRAPDIFGVAGTRPTGFGRYAGVAAIIAFVWLLYSKKEDKLLKFIWFSLFSIFFFILVFAKGRTAVIGFIVSIVFIILFSRKINFKVILGAIFMVLFLSFIILYNIPCANKVSFANSSVSEVKPLSVTPAPASDVKDKISVENNVGIITQKKLSTFSTLTGRTTGVWPDSWRLFLSNPIFGYGFQADRIFLDGQHAHNILMQALVQTGILGTVPLMLAFILSFIYIWQIVKSKEINEKEKMFLMQIFGVFIFFMVRSITESTGAYFDADWLLLAPIIFDVQYKFTKLSKSKNQLSVNILGKKIDIIGKSEVLEKISYWIEEEPNKNHWAVVCGMHGIVEGYKNRSFMEVINSAEISLIDGMSLVFAGKLKGFNIKDRIAGPDLMKESLGLAEKKGYSNFFLGDTEDTLKKMKEKLIQDFPKLKIAGSYSPPFGDFSKEENEKILNIVNQSKADILWIAFSMVKQEEWIYKFRKEISCPVVVGVGAGFKFLSGKLKRAPKWVGNMGFEWLWRLFCEPKNMWQRVFLGGPVFVWIVFSDLINFKHK